MTLENWSQIRTKAGIPSQPVMEYVNAKTHPASSGNFFVIDKLAIFQEMKDEDKQHNRKKDHLERQYRLEITEHQSQQQIPSQQKPPVGHQFSFISFL